MANALMGVETEYAVAALDAAGGEADRDQLVLRLLDVVWRAVTHLPDVNRNGVFLENGARFYVDCGSHPELATPECAHPWDVVRFVAAGEHLLLDLAERAAAALGLAEVAVLRSNVDYQGSTWGCHESYLLRGPLAAVTRDLLPHLVSRLVYAGAGGFHPLSPGLEFSLSPRAAYLTLEMARDSTASRGILHAKEEALAAGGYGRLHLICGESLCSQEAALLKVGTTALVVAMAEAGLEPGRGVALTSPLAALRAFAADPSCRVTVGLAAGGRASALDIQDRYLERAEDAHRRGLLPHWAGALCQRWRAMLERLRRGPEAVARTLDWAIKWDLYRRWAAASVPQERWLRWSRTVAEIGRDGDETAAAEVLARRGLDHGGLAAFRRLRAELLEADARFGQLGRRGIFTQLDARGLLEHRVVSPEGAVSARTRPPASGRARLRGEWVRRLHGGGGRYRCDWQCILDDWRSLRLDLSDPFALAAEWRPHPEPAVAAAAGDESFEAVGP